MIPPARRDEMYPSGNMANDPDFGLKFEAELRRDIARIEAEFSGLGNPIQGIPERAAGPYSPVSGPTKQAARDWKIAQATRPVTYGGQPSRGINRQQLQQRITEQPFKRAQMGLSRFNALPNTHQRLIEEYTAAGYSRFEIQQMVRGMSTTQAQQHLSQRFDRDRWQQYSTHVKAGAGSNVDPTMPRESPVSLARWQHMPEHLKLRMLTGIHVSRLDRDAGGNVVVPEGFFQPKTDTQHVYPTGVITQGSHLGRAGDKLVTTFKADKLLKRTALLGKHETVELRGPGIGGQRRASWRSNEWSRDPELIQTLNSAAVIGGSPGPAGQFYMSNQIKEVGQRVTQEVWDDGRGFGELPRIGSTFKPGAGITLGSGRTPINRGDKWGHRVLDIHNIERDVQVDVDPRTNEPIFETQRGKRFVLDQFAAPNEALVRGKAFWQKGVGTTEDLSNIRGASNIQMLSELKDVGGYAYAYWMTRPQGELAQAMGVKLDDVKNLSYSELFGVGKTNPIQAFEQSVMPGLVKTIQRPEIVSGHNLPAMQGKYTGTPQALGNNRFRVMSEYQALVAPVAMQASTDFPVRNPFLGYDELEALKLRDRTLYDRIVTGGAQKQQAYRDVVDAALATTGDFRLPGGASTLGRANAEDIISSAQRSASAAMPDAGDNIPRYAMQKHFADRWAKQQGFSVVPTPRGDIVLPPGASLEEFRASGEFEGEEVSQLVGRTFDLMQAYQSGDKGALEKAALRYQQQQLTIAGGEQTVRKAMGSFVSKKDMLGTVVRGSRALHPNEVYVPGMEGKQISMFRFPTQGGNEYSMSFRGMTKRQARKLGLDTKSMYTSIQLQQALAGDYDGDLAYALKVGAIQTDKSGNLVTQSGRKLSSVNDVFSAAQVALKQGAGNLVDEYAGGITQEQAIKKLREDALGAHQLSPEQLSTQLKKDKGLYDKIGQYYNTFTRGMASLPGGNIRRQLSTRGALQKVFNISHGFAQRPQKLPAGAQHIQDLMTYNMTGGGYKQRAWEEGDPGSGFGKNYLRGISGLRDEALPALMSLYTGDDPGDFALSAKDVARSNLPANAPTSRLSQITGAVEAWRGSEEGSLDREQQLRTIKDLTGSGAEWSTSGAGSMLSSRSVFRTAQKEAEKMGIDPNDLQAVAGALGQMSMASLGEFQGAEGQALLQSLFQGGIKQEQAVTARHKPRRLKDFAEKAQNLKDRAMAWGNQFVAPKSKKPQYDQAIGPEPAFKPAGLLPAPRQPIGLLPPPKAENYPEAAPAPAPETVSALAPAVAAIPTAAPPPTRVEGVGAGMETGGGWRGGKGVASGGGQPPGPAVPPVNVPPTGGGSGGGGDQRPIELSKPKISAQQLQDIRTLSRGLSGVQVPTGSMHQKDAGKELWGIGEAAYRQQLNISDIRRRAFMIADPRNPLNSSPEQVRAAKEIIRRTDPDSSIDKHGVEMEQLRDWMMTNKTEKPDDPVKQAKDTARMGRIDTKLGGIEGRQGALRLGRLGGALNLDPGVADATSQIQGLAQERRARYEAVVPKIQEYNQALGEGRIGYAQRLHDQIAPVVSELKDLKENIGLLKPEVKEHVEALKKQTSTIKEEISQRKEQYTALGQKLTEQDARLAEKGKSITAADQAARDATFRQMRGLEGEIKARSGALGERQAQIDALEGAMGEYAGGSPRALGKRPLTRGQMALGELTKGYDPQRLFYQSQALMQGYFMIGQPLMRARESYLNTQFAIGQSQYALGAGSMPQSVLQSQVNQANLSRLGQAVGGGVEDSWVMRGMYATGNYVGDHPAQGKYLGNALTGAVAAGGAFFGGKMVFAPAAKSLWKLAQPLAAAAGRSGASTAGSLAGTYTAEGFVPAATRTTAAAGRGWGPLGIASLPFAAESLGTAGYDWLTGSEAGTGQTLLNQTVAVGAHMLGAGRDYVAKVGDPSNSAWGTARKGFAAGSAWLGDKILSGYEAVGLIGEERAGNIRGNAGKFYDRLGNEGVVSALTGGVFGGSGTPDQEQQKEIPVYIKRIEAEVARQLGLEKAPMESGETAMYAKAFAEYSGVTEKDLLSGGSKFQDITRMIAESKRSGISFEEFFKVYHAAPGAAGYAPGTATGYGFTQWVNQGSLLERQQRLETVQEGAGTAGRMSMSPAEQKAYNNRLFQMRQAGVSEYARQQFQSMRGMGNQYFWSAAAYQSGNSQLATMDEQEPWRPKYQREQWAIEDRRRQEDIKRDLGTQTTVFNPAGQEVSTTWSGGRQQQEIDWQNQKIELEEKFWGIRREHQDEDFKMSQKMFAFQIEQMEFNLGLEKERASYSETYFKRQYAIQKEMFDLQTKWQREDFNKQEQRSETQRAWQIEDFGANRQQFELQAGWALEDAQRNLRYATGRDRLDIRRQMERSEIMNNLKRDDMGRQEARAETQYQWGKEDLATARERFETLRPLQEELMSMGLEYQQKQAEWAEKNQEFQERQIGLLKEQNDINVRQYHEKRAMDEEDWEFQQEITAQKMEWQEQDLERARERAKEDEIILGWQREITTATEQQSLFMQTSYDYAIKLVPELKAMAEAARDIADAYASSAITQASGGAPRTPVEPPYSGPYDTMMAEGGPTFSPTRAMLSEYGQEEHVVPSHGSLVLREPGLAEEARQTNVLLQAILQAILESKNSGQEVSLAGVISAVLGQSFDNAYR